MSTVPLVTFETENYINNILETSNKNQKVLTLKAVSVQTSDVTISRVMEGNKL